MFELIVIFSCLVFLVVSMLYFYSMHYTASKNSISHIYKLYHDDREAAWGKHVDGKITLEEYYEFKMVSFRAENTFIKTRYS